MQTFIATVISKKTPQTVGVEITSFKKHPKYQKIIKQTTHLLAHNEMEKVNQGDIVKIIKTRPYSKLKHFKVVEIVSQSTLEQVAEVVKPKIETKTAKPKVASKSKSKK